MRKTPAHLPVLMTAMIASAALTGCSDSDSKSNPGNSSEFTVSGTAKNFYTGAEIDNATVRVAGVVNGETIELGSTETDASGRFSVTYKTAPTRLIISGEGDEYGEYSIIVNNETQQRTLNAGDLLLQPAQFVDTIDPSINNDIQLGTTTIVSLTANSLVNENGDPAEGEVATQLTVIDPSSNPALMPGDYQTIDGDSGDINLIESFGAISATFKDENGNDLNLAEGQTATIRIPLAEGIDPATADATIPLFYFDEMSGYWIEEGTATLTQLANNEYVYEGTVSHFTVWNADKIYETIDIIGCVKDAEGNPVSNVDISSQGLDYIGSSDAISNAEGIFTLPARMNSELLISARSNSVSNTRKVITEDTDVDLTNACLILQPNAVSISLTWQEEPRDLDSHLFGPADLEGTTRFHISYENETETVDEVVIELDVDDTTSFGPEVITIPKFPYPGTYQYYVHHFSGEGTITSSPARVEVKIGDEEVIFSPSNATGDITEIWAVFNIEVDENLTPTVTAVQEYVDAVPGIGDSNEGEGEGEQVFEATAASSSNSKTHAPSVVRRLK